MNKKQLIAAWVALPLLALSLFLSLPCFSYAGNLVSEDEGVREARQKAPELIIHEEDLTYDKYKDSLKLLTEALDKYRNRKSKETGWEVENIGVHNWLLTVEGYGFKAQRDIAKLELKNAKFDGAPKEKMANLEAKLKEADKKLKYFLGHHLWAD